MNLTIREVFIQAFGPIPDDATCHLGTHIDDGMYVEPVIRYKSQRNNEYCSADVSAGFWRESLDDDAWGPDISNRLASEFVGLFDDKFDEIVRSPTLSY